MDFVLRKANLGDRAAIETLIAESVIVDAKGIIRYRKVLLRARRPTDYKVISAIYAAQTDFHLDKFKQLAETHRKRISTND